MKMKKTAATMAVMLLAPLSIVATAPAANAANAPSCVKVKVTQGTGVPAVDSAKVTNNCPGTKKLKVVWHLGPDSKCTTLKPGKSFTDGPGNAFAYYDKTVTC